MLGKLVIYDNFNIFREKPNILQSFHFISLRGDFISLEWFHFTWKWFHFIKQITFGKIFVDEDKSTSAQSSDYEVRSTGTGTGTLFAVFQEEEAREAVRRVRRELVEALQRLPVQLHQRQGNHHVYDKRR